MPFYHKKNAKHGRRSAYQVTKEWKEALVAKELERAEKKKARKKNGEMKMIRLLERAETVRD